MGAQNDFLKFITNQLRFFLNFCMKLKHHKGCESWVKIILQNFLLEILMQNGPKMSTKKVKFTKINTPPWVFFTFFKLHK